MKSICLIIIFSFFFFLDKNSSSKKNFISNIDVYNQISNYAYEKYMGDKMKLIRLSKSIIFSNSKKEFALSRITKDTFIEAKLKKIDCRFIRLSLSFCDSLQCGKLEFF